MSIPAFVKSTILTIFLFSICSAEYVIIRKNNPTKKDIQELLKNGYDIAASKVDEFVDIYISEDELSKNRNLQSFKIIDTESKINKRAFFNNNRKQSLIKYQTYDEYVENLNSLQEQYSSIMKVYNAGISEGKKQNIEGYDHDIWVIKVSDNVEEEEAEPGFLFVGEHHARETQSFVVTYEIMNYLLVNYSSDQKIKNYVDNNQIYFVPLLNPNGYTITKTINGMWRKNANLNGTIFSKYSFNTGSYVGVDLNRNYSYMWGEVKGSSAKNSDTYMGTVSFSERETFILDSLVNSLNIQAAITFHSHAEAILIPYCHNKSTPSDITEIKDLASNMAQELKKDNGSPYDIGTPDDILGYGVSGVMTDHMYANYGIFTYCVELWTAFHTKEEDLPKLSDMCIKAAEKMLDRASYKTLKGVVTLNGNPVKAKIELSNIDDNTGDRTDYYSFEKSGLYVRFIPAGTYTLTATLDDDSSSIKVINNVVINDNEVTVVNIEFGITENNNSKIVKSSSFNINKINNNKVSVTIPSDGKYNLTAYTLNGKAIINWNGNLKKGFNEIALKKSFTNSQTIIIKLAGKNRQILKREIIK